MVFNPEKTLFLLREHQMNKKTYHYVQQCSFFNVCQQTGWKKGPSSREGDFFITLRLCPSKKLDRVAKSGSKIFIVAPTPFHPNPSWYYCHGTVQIYQQRIGKISCTALLRKYICKDQFWCWLRKMLVLGHSVFSNYEKNVSLSRPPITI